MDASGAGRLNRSSPSCLNRSAQRIDFFHGLLNELVKDQVIDLAEGQGHKNVDSTLSLGAMALFLGLEMSLDDYGAFLKIVSNDEGVVAHAILTAFVRAAETAGVLHD